MTTMASQPSPPSARPTKVFFNSAQSALPPKMPLARFPTFSATPGSSSEVEGLATTPP